MDRTVDFGSSGGGSTPPRGILTKKSFYGKINYKIKNAIIAQLAERFPCKENVAGSIPADGSSFFRSSIGRALDC